MAAQVTRLKAAQAQLAAKVPAAIQARAANTAKRGALETIRATHSAQSATIHTGTGSQEAVRAGYATRLAAQYTCGGSGGSLSCAPNSGGGNLAAVLANPLGTEATLNSTIAGNLSSLNGKLGDLEAKLAETAGKLAPLAELPARAAELTELVAQAGPEQSLCGQIKNQLDDLTTVANNLSDGQGSSTSTSNSNKILIKKISQQYCASWEGGPHGTWGSDQAGCNSQVSATQYWCVIGAFRHTKFLHNGWDNEDGIQAYAFVQGGTWHIQMRQLARDAPGNQGKADAILVCYPQHPTNASDPNGTSGGGHYIEDDPDDLGG